MGATVTEPPPNVHIQWKGTDVCLDFRCVCGEDGHFDGYFAYAIRCPTCGRVYKMPDTFALVDADPACDYAVTAEPGNDTGG